VDKEHRTFILRAAKKEHYTLWVETLSKLSEKFRSEREISLYGRSGDKSPREMRNNNELDFDTEMEKAERSSGDELTPHLQQIRALLEKVNLLEELLNSAEKTVEKFKQKAYALEELLEFQRDKVAEPDKKINALMLRYTSVEKAITALNKVNDGAGPVGAHEVEIRMKLMMQRSEQNLKEEKKNRKELEERLVS
jgi:hypothetical protein